MRKRPLAFAVLVPALALALTSLPTVASAEKLERPSITLTKRGSDLEIVVHNVTDFCAAAETKIVRTSDSIRILRDRPAKASRCLDTRDLTFVVPNIEAGRYAVTYERLPLIAPIRWMQVASATAFIE